MGERFKQTIFVNGLIHNANQDILMVRRSLGDRFLPGYLELPGGRVQLGETLSHALNRKLQAELNIQFSDPVYYMDMSNMDSKGPYLRVVFLIAYNPVDPIVLSSQHDEAVWVNSGILHADKVTNDARKILLQFQGDRRGNNDVYATTLYINTDGGSRGNPGPSASAYVIKDGHEKVRARGGEYIGLTTNNVAEYKAVELALVAAGQIASRDDSLIFRSDSLLVVNQLNGQYKVKNRELWPINQKIRTLIKGFANVRFNHIPRELNVEADSLANDILDSHDKSASARMA
ncbi:reverse transcriptase-like protein [Candidatus Nomurabacteria bacterium]|jgi:ribonuclease HI|nr:reverse transcriptase-like protein [Candidatus Saccharibacteria bacterium]MCA9313284.1 reverse transcriptase-like protein [Candidatus Saccharibacteria bacterium]MCB9822225.1 reverse transcriptase-like protein [Candidatus Nomurabacteria bacterium]MDQ5969697.1 ribonuclease [Patescibacteria group bacterium]